MGSALVGLLCLQSLFSDSHQSLFCILLGGSLLHCECKEAMVLGLHHIGRLQLTEYSYVKCCILLHSLHNFIRTSQAIMNLH